MSRLAATLAALALLLAACQPAAKSTPTPGASVDLLRIAWADVGYPTPFRISTAGPGGAVLLTLIYDTLTWKDEQGIIPWLATRWTTSPDGLVYTFTLAPNVRWQDGRPLTAQDVAYSFQAYARTPYRWMSTAMVADTRALADDSVEIRLTQPYAPFLEDVAGTVPIIPEHVWAKVDDPATYGGPDATLGSGPYRLAEYRAAEGAYRLLANPDYFKGAPAIREVQQLNTPVETRLQALRQGQIDLVQGTDASVADALRDDPKDAVFETQPLSVVRLALNTARAPLDRREVRQALAYALDRDSLAQSLTHAPAIVGSLGVVPPETPWFNPAVRTYPFDLSAARSLLGGQPLTLELLADPTAREPELMQPALREAGITLDVKRVDAKTRTQLLREGSFQLGLVGHIGVGGDPDYLRRWYSGEEANDFAQGSVFADASFDALGRAQVVELDPTARRVAVFRMQDVLANAVPTIPLYYRRFYWAYDRARFTPMNTWGGLLNGAPLVQNKLAFLPPTARS